LPENGAGPRALAEDLVVGTDYKLETHCIKTEDGFVLVLHRLVPTAPSPQVRTRPSQVAAVYSVGE
jgi:hypothetical protein